MKSHHDQTILILATHSKQFGRSNSACALVAHSAGCSGLTRLKGCAPFRSRMQSIVQREHHHRGTTPNQNPELPPPSKRRHRTTRLGANHHGLENGVRPIANDLPPPASEP